MQQIPSKRILYGMRNAKQQTGKTFQSVSAHEMTCSHSLLFLLSGKASLIVGENRLEMRKDSVYYCPANTLLQVLNSQSESEVLQLEFDVLMELMNGSFMPIDSIRELDEKMRPSAIDKALQLARQVHREWNSNIPEDKLLAQAGLYQLVHLVLTAAINSSVDLLEKLDLTRKYLHSHYRDTITIADLAQQMDVSVKYYMELFRRYYGISAKQYLTDIRMEAARRLLARGGASMYSVARDAGYKDEFYFSRRFKQVNGVSPTVFMQSRKRKIAVLDSSFIGLLLPLNYVPLAAPVHPVWRSYFYQEIGDQVSLKLSVGRSTAVVNANIKLLSDQNERFDMILYPDYLNGEQIKCLELTGVELILVEWNRQSWQKQLATIAERLEAQVEVERWMTGYRSRLETARVMLQERTQSRSLLFMLIEGSVAYQCYDRGVAEVVFGELGLQPATSVNPDMKIPLSIEQLLTIDPDYLMLLIYQDEETMNYWQELQQEESWHELKAVRSGRIYSLAPFPWRDYAPLSLDLIINELSERLSADVCP
ncbi:helix-turn-helix domain-containing protein [Paenibacillus sp. GSMTC-2017]|uniref:helix-turn-helix domain-containing protein n=1 Tax=Paenibacillus sp. GSMTC-2017 TaxID=2794350 RepID=UPI0018D77142|nr:helix-turn-helix domain-containing protein [Paenibacillus sp. GSMTC-2017]MBH5318747.1 helix-turn-helix domain-containing protein [Paenibacillus sp. GSMTC-2017]